MTKQQMTRTEVFAAIRRAREIYIAVAQVFAADDYVRLTKRQARDLVARRMLDIDDTVKVTHDGDTLWLEHSVRLDHATEVRRAAMRRHADLLAQTEPSAADLAEAQAIRDALGAELPSADQEARAVLRCFADKRSASKGTLLARAVDEHVTAAEQAQKAGRVADAHESYKRAAVIEEACARACASGLRDTLRVSAVTLWAHANETAEVQRLTNEWLADNTLSSDARAELEARA